MEKRIGIGGYSNEKCSFINISRCFYHFPDHFGDCLCESITSIAEPEYLLRAYEGKLAVFTKDLVTPDLVFDVYVRTLPETDQEQLQRGIWVASYDKLTELVEDYIS